jgi:hypothetical protein
VIVDHLRGVLLPDPLCWKLGPAGLLTLLNIWLAPVWDESGIFVAAQALLLQADGTLLGSNAAIPAPRRRTVPPGSVAWNLPGGAMLGPVTPQTWTEDALALAAGEGLLAFTDGVSEAGNPQFGQAHLDAFLTGDPLGPGLVSRLFAAVATHVGPGWPADDATAFWLQTKTPSPAVPPHAENQAGPPRSPDEEPAERVMATAPAVPTPGDEYAALYGGLNGQLQRLLACRVEGPEGYITPEYALEEQTLSEMLLPVLRRFARGKEEVAAGALVHLCLRWRRNRVTHITPAILRFCLADAAREDQWGLALLSPDGPELASAGEDVPSELIRLNEQVAAQEQVARLCQELHRFRREALNDAPRLRALFEAMPQAGDLARGFQSRYAGEVGVAAATVNRWLGELQGRFDEYLRAVEGLPASRPRLPQIIHQLREFFPDGLPGEEV